MPKKFDNSKLIKNILNSPRQNALDNLKSITYYIPSLKDRKEYKEVIDNLNALQKVIEEEAEKNLKDYL